MVKRLFVAASVLIVVVAIASSALLYWLLSGDGVRLALEAQASAWFKQPVHIGRASVAILPRPSLSLGDVRIGEPASISLAQVNVAADLAGLITRRIENARVEIANSRIALPIAMPESGDREQPAGQASKVPSGGGASGMARTTGSAATSPAVDASTGSVVLVSVRDIALRNIVLTSRGRELTASADAAYAGNRLVLDRFTATSGRTSLEASGEVDLERRVDARLKVRANRLDLDELLGLVAAFAPTNGTPARGDSPPPRVAARVSAETATAGGLTVQQFATDLQIDGNAVSLSPVTFQLFGGRYQGSMQATMGQNLRVSLRSRIADLDVAQLAAFGQASNTVTGRLTGAASFSGAGEDIGAVLASAEGTGTAEIVKGSIARLGLVRTIVLFFGRPDPGAPASSDVFDRMDLRFSVARGVVRAEAFAMRSPDADIVGSGTLDTASKALDGRFDLSLSEGLSAQAGTDFRRYTREGNRVLLPARVTGTLDRPSLRIDAVAAVTRGLRNEVEDRLKGLLDRLPR